MNGWDENPINRNRGRKGTHYTRNRSSASPSQFHNQPNMEARSTRQNRGLGRPQQSGTHNGDNQYAYEDAYGYDYEEDDIEGGIEEPTYEPFDDGYESGQAPVEPPAQQISRVNRPRPTARTQPSVRRPHSPTGHNRNSNRSFVTEPDFEDDYDEYDYIEPVYSNRSIDHSYQAQYESPSKMAYLLMTVGVIIALLLTAVFTFMKGLSLGANPDRPGRTAETSESNSFFSSRVQIAPFFAPSVKHWEPDIVAWAERHNLDPNMVATVMQVESCGDPQALSGAGAMGLFQVMPYHFLPGEDGFEPEINALRGMNYLADRLIQTGGEIGHAFAGYNGGQAAAASGWNNWAAETQRYYTWTTGIYAEATEGHSQSETLDQWMAAGGRSLCQQAEARLGIN